LNFGGKQWKLERRLVLSSRLEGVVNANGSAGIGVEASAGRIAQ
jgi:hypothetical protein